MGLWQKFTGYHLLGRHLELIRKGKNRVFSFWIITLCTHRHKHTLSPLTSPFFKSQTSLISILFSWKVHSSHHFFQLKHLPTDLLKISPLYYSKLKTAFKKNKKGEFNFSSLCHPFPLALPFFLCVISSESPPLVVTICCNVLLKLILTPMQLGFQLVL